MTVAAGSSNEMVWDVMMYFVRVVMVLGLGKVGWHM